MVNVHPLALTRSIIDPIHGLVRMTQEEHEVMNSRVFQRLRRIKQNGLLHLVFPSATHNRFEHSLGVLFVADSVLQALLFNAQASRGKLAPLAEARPRQAVDLGDLDEATTRDLFKVTRLAALVHDLGHGPFSHSFEEFAPRRADMRARLDDPRLAALAPLQEVLLAYPPARAPDEERPFAHEAMSCVLFTAIWQQLRAADEPRFEPWMPLAVSAALLGEAAFARLEQVPTRLRPWLPLVGDIVASAPVDADRMDYMERDSRSCGVAYGVFDRNRVLKSALCYLHDDAPTYRLGWKKSGLRAIEVFVQARFQLFAQVYYHKTNTAANRMMHRIAGLAREQDVDLFAEKDLDGLVASYCDLGDEHFLRILCGEAPGLPSSAVELRSLARSIAERRLYKRVYEATGGLSARHMRKLLCMQAPEGARWAEHLEVDESRLDATKQLDRGAALLERDEEGIYIAASTSDWLSASPILSALHHEEKKIERLYWTGPAEQAAALRELAHRIAGEPES